MCSSDLISASTKSTATTVLTTHQHSRTTIMHNQRLHYDRPVMFFGGGRRTTMAQTRVCDSTDKPPSSLPNESHLYSTHFHSTACSTHQVRENKHHQQGDTPRGVVRNVHDACARTCGAQRQQQTTRASPAGHARNPDAHHASTTSQAMKTDGAARGRKMA